MADIVVCGILLHGMVSVPGVNHDACVGNACQTTSQHTCAVSQAKLSSNTHLMLPTLSPGSLGCTQELEAEYAQAKGGHDSAMAAYDTRVSSLETEVSESWSGCTLAQLATHTTAIAPTNTYH